MSQDLSEQQSAMSLLKRSVAPPHCATEEAFRQHWNAIAQRATSPFDYALAGGLIADRMAWVFAAGYQAAIRASFDIERFDEHCPTDWLCVAVSEPTLDPANTQATAGVEATTVEGTVRLNGNKSWIAACDSIDALIVKAERAASARCFYVRADATGLVISKNSSPKILPELSQGRAHFSNSEISGAKEINKDKLADFSLLEIFYIFVALSASVYAASYANRYVKTQTLSNNLVSSTDAEPEAKVDENKSRHTELYQQAKDTIGALSQCPKIDRDSLKPFAIRVNQLLATARELDPKRFSEQDQKLIAMYTGMLNR